MDENPEQVAAQIVRDLEALEHLATEPMRAVRCAWSRRLRSAPGELVLGVARAILAQGSHRWIAYELIAAHRAAFRSLDLPQLEALGRGIESWSAVDAFARTLSGPAWRDGLIGVDAVHGWARSPDRWWRRAALVSTVALNVRSRGGKGDVPRTLEICEMVVDDRDDMVVKALSWALRELVVHDEGAVRAFLEKHGPALASRVRREVTHKLETGLKNP